MSTHIHELQAREDDLHEALEAEKTARYQDAEAFDADTSALCAKHLALTEELEVERMELVGIEDALRKRLHTIVEGDVTAFVSSSVYNLMA